MTIACIKLEHPITVIYLNGKKILEYYHPEDERNYGECEIENVAPRFEIAGGKIVHNNVGDTTLLYNDVVYVLDDDKCEMLADCKTGTTTFKLFSKAENKT